MADGTPQRVLIPRDKQIRLIVWNDDHSSYDVVVLTQEERSNIVRHLAGTRNIIPGLKNQLATDDMMLKQVLPDPVAIANAELREQVWQKESQIANLKSALGAMATAQRSVVDIVSNIVARPEYPRIPSSGSMVSESNVGMAKRSTTSDGCRG